MMPDIPNVPGVPALSSYGLNDVILLAADAVTALLGLPPVWGVFLNGFPVFPLTSTVTFEYKQDWAIPTYPVEKGEFQSYDKVQLPFDVRVKIASGPSTFERQFLLKEIDIAANSLNLYDIITPERIFTSCNITHYDYQRTNVNGIGMIIADIWFQEVRESFSSLLQSTASAVVAGQLGGGTAEAVEAPSSIADGISSAGGPQ